MHQDKTPRAAGTEVNRVRGHSFTYNTFNKRDLLC